MRKKFKNQNTVENFTKSTSINVKFKDILTLIGILLNGYVIYSIKEVSNGLVQNFTELGANLSNFNNNLQKIVIEQSQKIPLLIDKKQNEILHMQQKIFNTTRNTNEFLCNKMEKQFQNIDHLLHKNQKILTIINKNSENLSNNVLNQFNMQNANLNHLQEKLATELKLNSSIIAAKSDLVKMAIAQQNASIPQNSMYNQYIFYGIITLTTLGFFYYVFPMTPLGKLTCSLLGLTGNVADGIESAKKAMYDYYTGAGSKNISTPPVTPSVVQKISTSDVLKLDTNNPSAVTKMVDSIVDSIEV